MLKSSASISGFFICSASTCTSPQTFASLLEGIHHQQPTAASSVNQNKWRMVKCIEEHCSRCDGIITPTEVAAAHSSTNKSQLAASISDWAHDEFMALGID